MGVADLYLVFARTGDSLARGVQPVVEQERRAHHRQAGRKMGLRASPTGELLFDQCRIPAAPARRGGDGLKIALSGLDGGRISIDATATGVAGGTRRGDELRARAAGVWQGHQRIRGASSSCWRMLAMKVQIGVC
jgi:alkylation response protein AidB-like acyl-CoA dehydrogenase